MVDEQRMTELERRVSQLGQRLEAVERRQGFPPLKAHTPPRARRPQPAPRPAAAPKAGSAPSAAGGDRGSTAVRLPASRTSSANDLEDLLGGRVLAWIGGAAVLLGIVFLFTIAVSRGWIGEEVRTLLGATASATLAALGVWLHERKARTDAALAAVATGVAGLFASITVAAQVYELIPVWVGLGLALVVAAAATGLAVRWDARGVAGLGIVGALLAPLFTGAPSDNATVAFLFVAGASAVGVTIWRKWDWLAFAAFLVALPQWVAWLYGGAGPLEVVVGLSAFWALGAVGAVGYELRVPAAKLRLSSSFLLGLNALTVAAAGAFALNYIDHETLAKLWLVGLAFAHLALGTARWSAPGVNRDVALVSLTLGVLLANVAFGLLADGLLLSAGWIATSVGFALLGRRVLHGADRALVELGLGTHLALAVVQALMQAPPQTLVGDDVLGAGAAASLVALCAGCLVSGRLAEEGGVKWRGAIDVLGMGALAYLTAAALDGPALAIAFAAEGAVLAAVASRADDPVARIGALSFLAGSALHALAVEATPDSLVYGLDSPLAAAAALGAFAAASLAAARRLPGGERQLRPALRVAAAVALLFVASAAIVTPFQPGSDSVTSHVLELGVRQHGQVLLSVFWATVGLVAVVTGLARDLHAVRVAGLALLLTTVGKVFLFDLATLTSVYRVVSFVGLGVLLLGAAFVWQRARPRALKDLREMPEGVR